MSGLCLEVTGLNLIIFEVSGITYLAIYSFIMMFQLFIFLSYSLC